jgi:hypothetical protein
MRGMATSGFRRKESTASFLSLDDVLPSMRTNLIPFSKRKTYMESKVSISFLEIIYFL